MQVYPSGTLIAGRYEVAGRPLVGGMGIVYLCFDHQEQRPVALKTFKPEFLPDRAARERFLEEGNTWVRLGKHPHIVRCYRCSGQPTAGGLPGAGTDREGRRSPRRLAALLADTGQTTAS